MSYTTKPLTRDVKTLVQHERFLEALYFGALELSVAPSAELHLFMGIACCGAIKPIALIEEALRGVGTDNPPPFPNGGLVVGRDTIIVCEGLEHLLEARRQDPSLVFEPSFAPAVSEVLGDLRGYLSQEFHGMRLGTAVEPEIAAPAAMVLLVEMGAGTVQLPPTLRESTRKLGERAIAQRLPLPGQGAVFHEVLAQHAAHEQPD